ncbi:MAG: stage II sporulation protein P [Peptococcaceae bacterium]|jgi:stage II sporulation protein P|nr:stage II sporulation protein P [Peptococcaceae bacterium]
MFYQNTWFRTMVVILFLILFLFAIYFCIVNNSSNYLIRILSDRSFPFPMLLLDGVPGLSQPQREYIEEMRYKAAALGMYFLTGVNISDARTYFLSFYAPPKQGISWVGWTYYPSDPEMEGPILEPLDNPFYNKPAPITSEHDALVGIYHTHNAECYAGNGGKDRVAGGDNGDVVKVGHALAEALNKMGVKTIQDQTVNDADYAESYNHSYETAKKMLEENPTIRILLDLHRDGIPPEVGKSIVKIDGQNVAKIMVVIGQKNPNWEKNNRIAEEIIKIAEEKYPGLFFTRITYASEARYNQFLTDGALLLEVGSQLNTLEEAMNATKPIAQVLKEYLQ